MQLPFIPTTFQFALQQLEKISSSMMAKDFTVVYIIISTHSYNNTTHTHTGELWTSAHHTWATWTCQNIHSLFCLLELVEVDCADALKGIWKCLWDVLSVLCSGGMLIKKTLRRGRPLSSSSLWLSHRCLSLLSPTHHQATSETRQREAESIDSDPRLSLLSPSSLKRWPTWSLLGWYILYSTQRL